MFHEHGDLRDRTFRYGRRVARLFVAIPSRNRLGRIYGEQLVRSANSVSSNYREAQRARSVAEYRSKLGNCLREADESLHWLECMEADGIFPPKRLSELKSEADQLVAIFVSLRKDRR